MAVLKKTAFKRPAVSRSSYHPIHHEENIQIKICKYIRKTYPHVIFISDSAAGLDLTNGQRIKMMKMRSHDGHPDLSIDFASRGYHGLRLELKKEGTVIYKRDKTLRKDSYTRKYIQGGKMFIKKGDHLAEQAEMLKQYNRAGYLGRFAIGYEKTVEIIDWYMKNENARFDF